MAKKGQVVTAVYAGSFDPVTLGHLDVIRRASRLFNRLVVGVGRNPDKREMFTQAERVALLTPHLAELPNTCVEAYQGLTTDFARSVGALVLVRGIRDFTDLSFELLQANVNRTIGGMETAFLLTSDQHVLTSSTYIRQVYEMGGGDRERIERLVPANVAQLLERKLGGKRPRRKPARKG
ncbi:MAG: pantetheine-phosphate adenylyltransferase [Phycisphaerae bacterium]|jgi:pantetheine-phosphate adenylyltransferase